MVPFFDMEKMQKLLQDFYMLTKIRIMVYNADFQELCSYPVQRVHICRMIRRNLQADRACMECDREACLAASKQNEPYIYTCHAGLTEAISPLRVNSVIVGYLSFGHLFSYDSYEKGWREIWKCVAQYGVDPQLLEQACRELPMMSREYILSAAHILDAVASFLVMQRMAVLKEDDLEVRLDRYISENFHKAIHIPDITKALGAGKTTLYKQAHKSYGRGLADQIRYLRMEKAKELLRNHPDMPLAEVAAACGYGDYNYFISVFTREVGIPPRQFRKNKAAGG